MTTTTAPDRRLLALDEADDLDPRGIRHPATVRELAFACWVEANGNADRARRRHAPYASPRHPPSRLANGGAAFLHFTEQSRANKSNESVTRDSLPAKGEAQAGVLSTTS
jgi:hypothetical protein